MSNWKKLAAPTSLLLTSFMLTACGGGGGDETDNNDTPDGGQQNVERSYSSVYNVVENSAASLAECGSAGGVEIKSGFDRNENSKLDVEEEDRTYFVCNGQDGVNGQNGSPGQDGVPGQNGTQIQQRPATTNECPTGGTIVTVDTTDIPICNSTATATTEGLNSVKAMLSGMNTWLTNVESLELQLANSDTPENATNELRQENMNELLKAIEIVVRSAAAMDESSDATIPLATLGAPLADQLASSDNEIDNITLAGSVTRNGLTITATGTEVVFEFAGADPNLTVNVDFDHIELPANSGSSFTLSIANLSASHVNANLSNVDGSAVITAQDEQADIRGTRNITGDYDIAFTFGTEAEPILLQTTDQSAVFEGSIYLDAVFYKLGLPNYIDLNEQSHIGDIAFDGRFTYEGQSVTASFAYSMTNADTFRIATPEFLTNLLDVNNGGIVLPSTEDGSFPFTLIATDVSSEFPFYASAIRYNMLAAYHDAVVLIEDNGNTRVEKHTPEGWYVESRGDFTAEDDELENKVARAVLNAFDVYQDGNTWRLFQVVDLIEDDAYFIVEADITSTILTDYPNITLPEPGASLPYTGYITEVGVNQPLADEQIRFGNTPHYEMATNIGIENISNGNGGVIPNASLGITASLAGFSEEKTDASITLEYDNQSFTGRFFHFIYASLGVEVSSWDALPLKGFTFTDNQGGLIQFNNPEGDDAYKSCWADESSIENCVNESAYINADIYYDGVHYGRIYNAYNGEWVAYFKLDGSEQLVFSPNN